MRRQSLSLDVYDDDITEYEEKLIAYVKYTTSPFDRCAIVINIVDNDWLRFNFSSNETLVIREDIGTYTNLSIVKNGENEPNVTVSVEVLDLSVGSVSIHQKEYEFTSNTAAIAIPIDIHDDDSLNGDRHFYLRFTALWYNYRNSLLVTEVDPNSIYAIIEDDEVAMVGFMNHTDIIIQEGGEATKVCVGFENSHENLIIDDSVYIRVDISPMMDDITSGYDLRAQPSLTSGLHFASFSVQECVHLSSLYDTNLNDSIYTLTLAITHLTIGSSVMVSEERKTIDIYSSDHHGIQYKSEPMHVTRGIGRDAFFPCTYLGPQVNPFWNISYPNETFQLVSTSRLPPKMFSNGSGLIIRDVDPTFNMTGYSCLFRIFDRDETIFVSSSKGVLTVLQSIIFGLNVDNNSSLSDTRMLVITEGDLPPSISVIQSGPSCDQFLVYISINISISREEQIEGNEERTIELLFHSTKREHSITLPSDLFSEDSQSEGLTTAHIEIADVIMNGTQTESDATVEIGEPLIVTIYNNDYYVGFTQERIILSQNSESEICLRIFDLNHTEIHPSHRIRLSIETDEALLLSSNTVTLTSSTFLECVSVTLNQTKEICGGNFTISTNWIKEEDHINVTLRNQQARIIINSALCPEPNTVNTNIIVIVLVIVSLLTAVILVIIFLVAFSRCRKKVELDTEWRWTET